MSTVEIQSGAANAHAGQTVRIKGHVQTVRDMGNLVFLVVRDQSATVQAVAESQSVLAPARALSAETPVIIEGTVMEMPRKPGQYEIKVSEIISLSKPAESLPVEISKAQKMESLSLSAMLDYRPLTLRSEKARAVFKLEAALCAAFREFLTKERFVEIHSPKIVSTGTEGGAQLFKIDYFGRTAYLAQSPQFYKQIMVGVFERVFEIGPVYRAEEHDTTRHLNEYISMDIEMGFIESEQTVIDMQARLLQYMFAYIKETCQSELALFNAQVPEFKTIPQMKLHEAIALLAKKLGWSPSGDGSEEILDLDPEGERLLCQHFLATEGVDLVYITHYPHRVRPFYAMPAHTEGVAEPLSHSFDLLFRGLEITTGGQRLHKHEELTASMKQRGLNPIDFKDYLQCFQYGMPPHGGLAIGLERLAKQLLGLPTVKLASLFPRDLHRLTP
jgi:nondiscriminating aspartyl-tRNA synthetase